MEEKGNQLDEVNSVPYFDSLQGALASLFGSGVRIMKSDRIAGGDINKAYRLTLTDGMRIFMKSNRKENVSFFQAEAAGLTAIAQTEVIGTPRILGMGTDDGGNGCSFLLLEYIDGRGRAADYWETFACELAAMHRACTRNFVSNGDYGFCGNNYIGSGHQENTSHESWTAFFRDCRLAPQFRRAAGYFDKADLKKADRILERIDSILVEPQFPSLLHGDLWSGNVIMGNDGKAWLIDPAVYVGHAEADIAMTELFGGFPQSFYHAYRHAMPMQPDYSRRRDLYNLYHLLNHLNLFGQTYLSSVKRVIAEYSL